MYRVEENKKNIKRLNPVTFKEYGLGERGHLQEWIAGAPLALGEELLILSKEFDGFEGTKERLDLLALDKQGRLVVIENKLDDSGRDVTWQAIKYTAYCSTLTQDDILNIYKSYSQLDAHLAEEKICNFLELESLDEFELNDSQRIFLISANFRKEVTATVLWLIEKGIDIRCFKTSLFQDDSGLLLDITQIIPAQEVQDFMIKMGQKKKAQLGKETELKEREVRRLEFWELFLKKANEKGVSRFANISSAKDHWLNAGSGVGGVTYTVIFAQDCVRVVLDMHKREYEINKQIFDHLKKHQQQVEEIFGADLTWLRLDDKISSRIQYEKLFESYDRGNWDSMTDWLCEHILKLEEAIGQYLKNLPSA